ncbi:hypothetical protein BVC93_18555 [Mycobacterium sp. MS1601]|uniref:hypothetical protein n=1 Tax=Mycobacterium sp. MS1601 TaxID=1936029 RepID=UPI00097957A8|nr:hypothetical protein [Mycobacterium sp. MS1601]AQA04099.1 hypothetical protein BVC93_18555 [Mycobacterium sp. MS1601]
MPDDADDEVLTSATPAGHRQQPASGWIAPLALVVALVAVAVSVWALTSKSAEPATVSESEPETTTAEAAPADPAAAKARVCAAVDTVSRAVQLQTNGNLGPDPVAQTAVAGNARLALLGGGLYLEQQLGDDAAPELAGPVRQFAVTLQDIGANALTGVTNQDPVQQGRLAEGDRLRQEIIGLCA